MEPNWRSFALLQVLRVRERSCECRRNPVGRVLSFDLQHYNDLFLSPTRAAKSAWNAQQMTPMARLLRQSASLYQRAQENTQDVNEAYLVVHEVMTRAMGRVDDHDSDLGPALARALDHRTQRIAALEAAR